MSSKIDFSQLNRIPLRSAEQAERWGKTMIVAPHPDDESLGCGGAIALICAFGLEVSILTLSDGTLSHPNSLKFPAEKLRALREAELIKAAKILGVKRENIAFFRYRDRSVPNNEFAEFSAAIDRCREHLDKNQPQTIFVPWRRDPHPDHRAAFQLISAAKSPAQRLIEYPIWLYELAGTGDAPLASEVRAFRLDITSVSEIKQQAIRAHASQVTDLIDDDPNGFRLSENVLANFAAPFEIYLEEV